MNTQFGRKGSNPFTGITVGDNKLWAIVKTYNPPFSTSSYIYNHIADYIAYWIDDAIAIRKKY